MLIKSLRSLKILAIFPFQNTNKFCTYSVPNIRNSNLRFDTPQWTVLMYPFYPGIYKKKQKSYYQVSNISIVLTLIFLNKTLDQTVSWDQRKSMSLKFKDVKLLMQIAPMSGAHVVMETGKFITNKFQRSKTLNLTDHPNQSKVAFNFRQTSVEISQPSQPGQPTFQSQKKQKQPAKQKQWRLETFMHYSQYRTFYKIVEGSLLDLSGYRFVMQYQKRQQFAKLEGKASDDQLMDTLFKN